MQRHVDEFAGNTLDIHGGGSDLVFPHHESERAQSEAATGETFVRHWMHCGMVAYQGTKMSKSLGNLVFVSELCKRADPRAIRLALMTHHYRSDWEWFDSDIDTASSALNLLLWAASGSTGPDPHPFIHRIHDALDNDLDAPSARTALLELAEAIVSRDGDGFPAPEALREAAALCGLDLTRPLATPGAASS